MGLAVLHLNALADSYHAPNMDLNIQSSLIWGSAKRSKNCKTSRNTKHSTNSNEAAVDCDGTYLIVQDDFFRQQTHCLLLSLQ